MFKMAVQYQRHHFKTYFTKEAGDGIKTMMM